MELQLKRLRKEFGYKTQGELAVALGVPERRYASWERGEVMMNLEQACRICDVLGCTLDELVGRGFSKPITNYADEGQRHLDEVYGALSDEGREKVVGYAEDIAFAHPRDRGEGDVDAGAVETA